MRKYLIAIGLALLINQAISASIKGNYAIKNVSTGMLLRVKDASNKNGNAFSGLRSTELEMYDLELHFGRRKYLSIKKTSLPGKPFSLNKQT
jgi:hypothetical protein